HLLLAPHRPVALLHRQRAFEVLPVEGTARHRSSVGEGPAGAVRGKAQSCIPAEQVRPNGDEQVQTYSASAAAPGACEYGDRTLRRVRTSGTVDFPPS